MHVIIVIFKYFFIIENVQDKNQVEFSPLLLTCYYLQGKKH